MSKPALHLLAIDPGMSATGLVYVRVTDYRHLTIEWAKTLRTQASVRPTAQKALIEARVHAITEAVVDFVREGFDRGGVNLHAVIEHPSFTTSKRKEQNHPHSIFMLSVAYGCALSVLVRDLGLTRVKAVPVTTWYPRSGRGMQPKGTIVEGIRGRYPSFRGSEHCCMAVALGFWWSENVAPRVWHELEQRASL